MRTIRSSVLRKPLAPLDIKSQTMSELLQEDLTQATHLAVVSCPAIGPLRFGPVFNSFASSDFLWITNFKQHNTPIEYLEGLTRSKGEAEQGIQGCPSNGDSLEHHAFPKMQKLQGELYSILLFSSCVSRLGSPRHFIFPDVIQRCFITL